MKRIDRFNRGALAVITENVFSVSHIIKILAVIKSWVLSSGFGLQWENHEVGSKFVNFWNGKIAIKKACISRMIVILGFLIDFGDAQTSWPFNKNRFFISMTKNNAIFTDNHNNNSSMQTVCLSSTDVQTNKLTVL